MSAEDQDKVSPEYLMGFNEGYTLSEHLPDLAGQLATAVNESDRGQGFKDGREQLLFEKTKEKLQDKGRQRSNEVEPDKSIDHDIDR